MHLFPPFLTGPFLVLGVLFIATYLGALGLMAVYAGPARKRTIKCPDNNVDYEVELDTKHAVLSFVGGKRELRVKQCDRWPEKENCGQECMVQIDPSPSVLARIFSQWYEGKSCGRCMNPLQKQDWDHGNVAVLNAGQLVELREIPLEMIPQALVGCVPLCVNCHEEELTRQPTPDMFFRYDPRSFEVIDDPKFHN